MTQERHVDELRGIADDYARELYRKLAEMVVRDGFTERAADEFTLTGMTIQTMLTLHLFALHRINPSLARLTRDIMEAQIKSAKEWL